MTDRVQEIISCLSQQHLKNLRKYLVAFANRSDDAVLQSRLLDLVLKYPQKSNKEYAKLLYGEINLSAYNRLSSRLYQKVLDSLLIDVNVKRVVEEADFNNAVQIQVRKTLLQYYVLRTSGRSYNLCLQLLNQVLKTSSKYEYYTTEIEVLTLLKFHTSRTDRKSAHKEWDLRIKEAEEKRTAYNKAFDWFNRYLALQSYQGNLSSSEHVKFLTEAVDSLTHDSKRFFSPTIEYFRSVLYSALLQHSGCTQLAITQCEATLELLKRYQGINTPMRVSGQYSNIASMLFELGHLNEALTYNDKSLSIATKGTQDYAYKQRFKIELLFHLGRINEAEELLQKVHAENVVPGELFNATLTIMEAAFNIAKGNTRFALSVLNMKSILSADKGGWEFAVRMMRIMCLIELELKDEAENLYQNLLRYTQRNSHFIEITDRNRALLKLVGELSKAGFELNKYDGKSSKILKQLLNDPKYTWRYGTPELIAFDTWLESKLRKKRGPKPGQKKKSNA
jgi:hypothetical protein